MKYFFHIITTCCAFMLTHTVFAQQISTITQSKSIFLNPGMCSRVLTLNDGANQAESVLLTSSSEGGVDTHIEAVILSIVAKEVLYKFTLPKKGIFETRDLIALAENDLIALTYILGKNYSLVKLDKKGGDIKRQALPSEFYPVGLTRLSATSFAVFGSITQKPALFFFDEKFNLDKKIILDQVEGLNSVFAIFLLPDDNLLLKIQGKQKQKSTVNTLLMKISKLGKMEKLIQIDAEDIGLSVKRSGEVLVTYYGMRNGEVSAIALDLREDLSSQWERVVYRQILSVARVASSPLESGWLVFGSQALNPKLFQISDKGDSQVQVKYNGSFAAPAISSHLKNYARSIVAVQENKPMRQGKPVEIQQCDGIRIDFWDESK